IDPSSSKNRGSILGDKTRMNELSALPNVFIRPSPAGDELGGVHRATRESILLCEAAGYDTIIIETVGVGQSEWAVHNMTDVFLLLAISGAGDELQGIKRGIMEMADIIAINKSDGDNEIKAQQAAQQIRSALHFFSSNEGDWTPRVINCSSLYNQHIDEVWNSIQQFIEHQKIKNLFETNRQKQQLDWFHTSLKNAIIHQFIEDKNLVIQEIEAKILSGDISPNEGVDGVIRG
ncbi:MAG: methylmalonyl Co-A mutase-associated GTPase MeaB, partial [Chitinophagales bacterium]|nr:methylmalonyl Co-A mutase-associated GTPase MeaB [Chitinophagales bacterium]